MASQSQETPPLASSTSGRDRAADFPLLKTEIGADQGFIWRTRSLDDSNPSGSGNISHDASHDEEHVPALHASFDAALLLDRSRISGPLFGTEDKLCSSCSFGEDDMAQGELSGRKHLRQRPRLGNLETNLPGTVRKQPRVGINTNFGSKTPARPRRPPGSVKKVIGNSTPTSALKRRLAPLHQRKSPMRRMIPLNSPGVQHWTKSPQPNSMGPEKAYSQSPKDLTPTRTISGPFGSTATKKSMSKWCNTGATATTTVLETTFESDSVDTSSPTTTRFRFTTFPASLPRINSNLSSRQCPDSVCKRMSFEESNKISSIHQSRDDDGTHNTSISSLSAEGGQHLSFHPGGALPPAVLELDPFGASAAEPFSSDGCPSHSQLFSYDENFGYSDDDSVDTSPMRDDIGRTRLDFNMLLSPASQHDDSEKENADNKFVMQQDLNVVLSQPYDQRRINSFPSSLSSNTQMNNISSCEETLTPSRPSSKHQPTTPREVQLHFPPEAECSPILRGDERCQFRENSISNLVETSRLSKEERITKALNSNPKYASNDVKVKEESSIATESTNSKLSRNRPMPDMSAFESVNASVRGDRSADDSMTLECKGMHSSHRLLCPPTPARTPAWASEGNSHLAGRQNSLIATKVLLACTSQVLEGRTSLENSILDDDSKASGSVSRLNAQTSQDREGRTEIFLEAGVSESTIGELGSITPQTRIPAPPRVTRRVPSYSDVGSTISFSKDFQVLCLLGSGTFADVYKVRSNRDGRLYAVKRNRRQFRGKRDRNMALAEVQHMQQLQNICADKESSFLSSEKSSYCLYLLFFYRAWQEDGYFFCQTELCCRDTCRELLDSLRLLWNSVKTKYPSLMRNLPKSTMDVSPKENDFSRNVPTFTVWKICHDISAGLSHIHSHGLVHHDIKPSNIFFVLNARFGAMCKIGDFGMAGDIGTSSDGQEGDARYMPTELLSSITRQPSADIFSLGLTLYEISSDHHMEMPSEGPHWHELRSNGCAKLPSFRGNELTQLIKAMTSPCKQIRPTADDILQNGNVISAGRGHDLFLRDYLLDIEEHDQQEEKHMASDCHEDQTPRNGFSRSGGAHSPNLSMLLPSAPNLLSPAGQTVFDTSKNVL